MNKTLFFFVSILLLCSCAKDNDDSNNLNIFTDSRDGEVYSTIEIGGQTWMAENLRYNMPGSYLNPNNPNEKYGRLYSWQQAMQACPQGWRLPNDEEWQILVDASGGNTSGGAAMKSDIDWDGTNSISFNALPGGFYYANDANFYEIGNFAFFWSATEYDAGRAWNRVLLSGGLGVGHSYNFKSDGRSCRCLKD